MNYLIKQGWLNTAVLFAVMSHSVMAEESDTINLSALQRKQVQTVSQAILASKRSVKPSSESVLVRQYLKQVRTQLVALTAPVGTVKLQLDTRIKTLSSVPQKAKSVVAISKQKQRPQWRQFNSKKIQHLENSLGQLKVLCDDEIARRKPAQLGLLQRVKAMVFKSQSDNVKKSRVVTSLSDAALQQLSQLQTEINTALTLPEQERHQQLIALAKQLQINPNISTPINDETEVQNTPTLISRTSHRRKF